MKARRTNCGLMEHMAVALALAVSACGDSNDYESPVYYPPASYDPYGYAYTYGYHYPADLAYTEAYYSDPYAYDPYGVPKRVGAIAKGPSVPSAAGSSIRAMSLGESACPGAATVTVESVPAPCSPAEGVDTVPTNTSIVFDDCVLAHGGSVDGSIDIQSAHDFSAGDCSDDSLVDVSFTSTSTGLSYSAPSGARFVVPSMTRSAAYTRPLRGAPSAIAVQVEGTVDAFDPAGVRVASLAVSGSQTLIAAETSGEYRSTGTMRIDDQLTLEGLTVTGEDVLRTAACCHPTGGTLEIGAPGEDADLWSFGPACGEVTRNGETIAAGECF